jgi:glycerol uptake facilitator-like aquaporin
MSIAVLHVRISGSLFNPAISFSLFLIGTLHFRRMGIAPTHLLLTVVFEFVAQFVGGIAGAYLLDAVTPFPMNVAASLVHHVTHRVSDRSHLGHPLCKAFSLNSS